MTVVVHYHPIPPPGLCLSVVPIPKFLPHYQKPPLPLESNLFKFTSSRASLKCCSIGKENTNKTSENFSVLKSDNPCDTGSVWSSMALYMFSFHIPLSFGGLSIVAQVLHQSVLDHQTQALSVLVLQTLELVSVFLLLRFTTKPQYKPFSFFEANKLSKERNWLLALALGFAFLVFLVFLTSFLADILIGPKDVNNPILKEILSSGPVSVTACTLVYCIVAPILEETVYRGFLLTHLAWAMEWQQAVVISSAVFSAAHLSGENFLQLFIIGSVLGCSYCWSGKLTTSILIHSFYNALTLLVTCTS